MNFQNMFILMARDGFFSLRKRETKMVEDSVTGVVLNTTFFTTPVVYFFSIQGGFRGCFGWHLGIKQSRGGEVGMIFLKLS